MHPGACGLIGRHAPDDLLPAEAQFLAHGHRHGGGIGHVLAGGRDAQSVGILRGGHGAGDAVHTVVHDIMDPHLAVLALAAADDPLGQSHGIQQGVVSVQDRQAVFLQMVKDLALGLQDALPAAQVLDVGVADVGDHGDVRPHHGPQILDLTKVVHARFDHRRLVLRGQAQQGQGRTDVVIEILRGLEDVQLRLQHGGDHFLRGGFAHAAGDLHEGDLKFVPVGGGQVPQGQTSIRYLDVELIRTDILGQLGAQAPCRTGVQRRVDKLVAVELLPHPGQE